MILLVAGMKKTTATSFLNELYGLYSSGWKYVKKKEDASNMTIDKNEDGNYNMLQGQLAVATVLFGSDHDETHQIRADFLISHGYRCIMDDNEIRVDSPCGHFYETTGANKWEKIPAQK